jgi:hypothetical protein
VSGGFNKAQLDNIGELKSHGIELSARASVVNTPKLSVNLSASAGYLSEEVVDMGGAPPLKTGGTYTRYRNFLKEGYAPGSYFGPKLQAVEYPFDLNKGCTVPGGTATAPTRQEALAYFSQPRTPDDFDALVQNCGGDYLGIYLGKPLPDWSGSVSTNIKFLTHFQLNSTMEFKAGNFFVQDLSGGFRNANAVIGRNSPKAARVDATLRNPESTAEQRLEAAQIWVRELRTLAPMSLLNEVYPADFVKWREVSLTYDFPGTLTRAMRVADAALTLSVRNIGFLYLNSAYPGMDPEVNILGRCTTADIDCNFLTSTEGWGIPVPRRFGASLRVSF